MYKKGRYLIKELELDNNVMEVRGEVIAEDVTQFCKNLYIEEVIEPSPFNKVKIIINIYVLKNSNVSLFLDRPKSSKRNEICLFSPPTNTLPCP